jgi:hypothetical protein
MIQILAVLALSLAQNDAGAPVLAVEKRGEEKVADGPLVFRRASRDVALASTLVGGKSPVLAYDMATAKRIWRYDFDASRDTDAPWLQIDGDRVGIQGWRFTALLDATTGAVLFQKTFDPGPSPIPPYDRAAFLAGNWICLAGQDVVAVGRDGKVLGTRKAAAREYVKQVKTAGGLAIVRSDSSKVNPDKTEQLTWSMVGVTGEGKETWKYLAQPVMQKLGPNQTRKDLIGFSEWWTDPEWMIGYAAIIGGAKAFLVSAKTGKLQHMIDVHGPGNSPSPAKVNGRSVVTIGGASYFLWGTSQTLDGSFHSRGRLWVHSLPAGKPVFSTAENEFTFIAGEHQGLLILDDNEGLIRALDPATGKPRWTYTGGRTGTVVVGNAWICFAKDRQLIVLDPATGAVAKTLELTMPSNYREVWRITQPPGFVVYAYPTWGVFDGERLSIGTLQEKEASGAAPGFMHGLRDPSNTRTIEFIANPVPVVRVYELKISRP